jgi:hypothetical protein
MDKAAYEISPALAGHPRLGRVQAYGVGLHLDRQAVDTTSPGGRALLQMARMFAELEREMTPGGSRRRRWYRPEAQGKADDLRLIPLTLSGTHTVRRETDVRVHGREPASGLAWRYLLIVVGAPHSSAETQEAQSVLGGMSRTGRSQRSHALWRLWRWTYSKNACSTCPSISQKPKLCS